MHNLKDFLKALASAREIQKKWLVEGINFTNQYIEDIDDYEFDDFDNEYDEYNTDALVDVYDGLDPM